MTYNVVSSYGHGNEQALDTMKSIETLDLSGEDQVVFDFNQFGENTPFNVLTIASYLKEYRARHPECNFSLIPKESSDFLSHFGFYQMIGAKVGKAVGEAQASSNYVPIKEIQFDTDFYRTIEVRAQELAKLLSFDKSLEELLSYAFVEAIRNVYEHSGATSAYVCAQKWPTRNLVEIAIADTGKGIAKALETRFPQKTEKELLYLSMQAGISARSNFGYLDKDDPWRNSGFGLYMMKKLTLLYRGSFLLCSGKHAIWVMQDDVIEYETSFPGTAIAIKFRTDTGKDFNELRSIAISEGQTEAQLKPEAIKKASKSSGGHYNG